MQNYTHLHLHTEYSLLDGANKIKVLAKKIKELGMTSVSMTDHGNMFGAIDFYTYMKKEGIKPIIGIETYLHNAEKLNDKQSRQRFHLCLYAKDLEGYQNLMYLSSQAFLEGFYYYPRINKKILRERARGLICSSACLQGEINWHLNNQNPRNKKFGAKGYEEAKRIALEYQDIFGDDFYMEIMRHGIADQLAIDEQVIRLSKETGIKLIATNDTHYTNKEDASAQEVAMCVAMGKTLNDTERLKHSVHEFYIKTPEEMARLFADIPEALAHTQEIADKCHLEIDLKNDTNPPTPPRFKFTKEYAQNEGLDFEDDKAYFAHKAREGLKKRLEIVEPSLHAKYTERLEYEIKTISDMKFAGYMLIVWDFIRHARESNIPVGPGRGSAAGSLVAFCLQITDIDPLKYDLLFERFLNPERVSMPDIDTDFCQRRRGEMLDYMIAKYGKYNVAQVITFNKMLAKGVIRDVARVLDMPYKQADEMAKLIPNRLGITLQEAFELEPKIQALIERDKLAKQVWDFSLRLENLNRSAGKHAAALVVDSERELWYKSPLYTSERTGGIVTQYSMKYLEAIDLIKFDFLGLKTLTVIHDALKVIEKYSHKKIDFLSVDMDDPKVYATIQEGNTVGIFQIESGMFQTLNKRLRPSSFEDIIAIIALGRPGPMESGMVDDFVNRKHGNAPITYMFDALEPILRPTYGTIVYQEQVMQIVQTIAGFSLGEADLIRRAMGKKDAQIMADNKAKFVQGAIKNKFDGQKAGELFDLIVKFAGYGFNKSHSAAYAMLTFQTAYLKTHYKHEFMAAMLSSECRHIESVAYYVEEASSMGIKVERPHVNTSDVQFKVEDTKGEKVIVFGLEAIKGAGEGPLGTLVEIREKHGNFTSLEDLISKIDFSKFSKRILEPLVKSGSLDGLGYNRRTMLENLDAICDEGRRKDKSNAQMSVGLFANMSSEQLEKAHLDLVELPEFDANTLLNYEYECMGLYFSGHPLDAFKDEIKGLKNVAKSVDIARMEIGSSAVFIGKVLDVKRKMGKNSGKPYGEAAIVDFSGRFELMLFEKQLNALDQLDTELPLAFKCKIEEQEEVARLRLLEIDTFENIKKAKIPRVRYKVQKEDTEDTQPVDLVKDFSQNPSSCVIGHQDEQHIPLSIVLDTSVSLDLFSKLKEAAASHKGNRALSVVFYEQNKRLRFNTAFKVSTTIKENFKTYKWLDN
ncbi:DNA polymerase III subunit alpha [Helicobacter sp. NHP22-001]|uniref:DNA polymerase III subunit alpha n=1 Tax=Helicobacter sp. NHP22-001 TaxID=3040202 RepID=UPI00244D858D|nr:DNA polymerase III subunit alpha [Helicobacter sp. NHP22-001]GMB95512.1 DNA polymerase III subunit alpha DnaE [Helicobacter sp. NHP22-001]